MRRVEVKGDIVPVGFSHTNQSDGVISDCVWGMRLHFKPNCRYYDMARRGTAVRVAREGENTKWDPILVIPDGMCGNYGEDYGWVNLSDVYFI